MTELETTRCPRCRKEIRPEEEKVPHGGTISEGFTDDPPEPPRQVRVIYRHKVCPEDAA